ncbi:4-deoxy-L-threo-5-hexosulose-uronate ketol-isomerase [Bacillus pakistanensis]|uniref:4-deoxy-L-threo-5-hexosulose-uronate ketol-isomerase n=1 Tax=Rossellomorea pakistanensis TaxID=992288 RepID=A0ABS2NHG3_9BACI|nr:5-dehydro-4-deoxy-D-glucuronate isomerase [Bacillus pakistanensis]MBM7587293.1 4-deoxy-L-threo-5-hexosulose-uronate ketol-isomerase [Bacillus pakistanensis]
MEVRHARHFKEVERMNTAELRENFLMESLFQKGEVKMSYTHEDRMIVGGAVPSDNGLYLEDPDTLKTDYFLERRELGIVNIGGTGRVLADGVEYELNTKDCLYVAKGTKEVLFRNVDDATPAKFYFVSTLAHEVLVTKIMGIEEATPVHLGSVKESNKRTIYKYIHADGIQSCQLMLGMTLLEDNSMWNTMPAHIHDRRSEIYLYFDMEPNTRIFHFMGKPEETRHLVIKNEQSVISPSWSIHSGIGTGSYTFIWAMAGENYTFEDMEGVSMEELK